MSDSQKQEAIQKLVKAGLKEGFATEVVEKSGKELSEIIKNPAEVLGEYWYANVAVDFLDDAVATTEDLRQGLTALQFQDSVVDRACARHPRPEWLGHTDIFNWGEDLMTACLEDSLYPCIRL